MYEIYAPSDEFARHDDRLMSMRKDSFRRLAGKFLAVVCLVTANSTGNQCIYFSTELCGINFHH